MQPEMLLCTLDITSLYTNIPHNEGIQSIKEILAIYRTPNNYHQVSGTAMGTKLAPSYASLFMT